MGFLASFLAGLFAAFAFGTFWFWTAAAVVAIVITALVENEEGAWATFVFLASLVGLNWLSRAGVGRFLVLHPWRVLAYVVVYFVAGAVWSLAKWYFYVRRQSAKYEEYKAAFLDKLHEDGGTVVGLNISLGIGGAYEVVSYKEA